MKKSYVAPELQAEVYELDMNIAGNCAIHVSNGPGSDTEPVCEDYVSPFRLMTASGLTTNFYETGGGPECDCYTTAGGQYWTS